MNPLPPHKPAEVETKPSAPPPRSPLVNTLLGVFVLIVAIFCLLWALNIIRSGISSSGPGRLMLGTFGALLVGTAVCLFLEAYLGSIPRFAARAVSLRQYQYILGRFCVQIFLSGLVLFLLWQTIAPEKGQAGFSIFGITLPVADSLSSILFRIGTGFFALVFGLVAVAFWLDWLRDPLGLESRRKKNKPGGEAE